MTRVFSVYFDSYFLRVCFSFFDADSFISGCRIALLCSGVDPDVHNFEIREEIVK